VIKIGHLLFFLFLFSFFNFSAAQETKTSTLENEYYSGSTSLLLRNVEFFLKKCEKIPVYGKILGLITSHGNYKTSGQTAAYAYRTLKGKKIDTVIIIGPSHNLKFPGASIYAKDYYLTPLGKVPVNLELAKTLIMENEFITFYSDPYSKEHSIEAQLPFLQRTLQNFQILPILIGDDDKDIYLSLSEALLKHLKDQNILIIASANLSNFRSYFDAALMDKETIKHLEEYNIEKIDSKFKSKESETCSRNSILTTMLTCQKLGADKIKLLKYTNSGEVTGIQHQTVGYASLVLYDLLELSEETKKWLLTFARQSLEEYLRFKRLQTIKEKDPFLNQELGVYLTIKKGKATRGYLGYVLPFKPLYQSISDGVIKAATEDLKYPPLTIEELPEIKIEISVLSNMEKINDSNLIEVGVHGLYVNKDWQSVLILPGQAVENKWSGEEFLEKAYQKAGLSPKAWKDKEVEIYTFTAQTFSE